MLSVHLNSFAPFGALPASGSMLSSAMVGLEGPEACSPALMQQQQPGGASSGLDGSGHWSAGGGAASYAQPPALEVQYGHLLQQQAPSSMLDDTFAAVMASNLGSSPLEDAPPECWNDAAAFHPYATTAAGQCSNSTRATFSSKQQAAALQQQQHAYAGSSMDGRSFYSAEPTAAAAAAAAAAGKLAGAARSSHPATNANGSDPNLLLYANYRCQRPEVYAEADRLSHASKHTAAASAAVAQHAQLVARMQQQQLATQQAAAAVQAAAAQAAAAAAAAAGASGRSALYGAYQLPMHAQQQHQQQQSMAAASGYAQHPGYLFVHASSGPQAGLQQQQPQQYSSSSASERSSLPPRHGGHSSHSHPYSSAAPSGLSSDTRHAASAGDASSRGGSAASAATMRTRAAAAKQMQAAQAQAHASQAAAASSGQPPQRQVVPVGPFAAAAQQHLQQAAATDQASLECDEDLPSMDLCDVVPQHTLASTYPAAHRTASGLLAAQLRQAGNARLQGGAGATADSGSAAARARASAVAAATAAAAAISASMQRGGSRNLDACEPEDEQQQFDWDEDEGQYDQEEDSGSTHPDSDNMEADDVVPQRDQQQHPHYAYHNQQQQHQQQQQQQAAFSAVDSRTLLAARASAAAVEAAAAERAAVSLRVLGQVASIRKGELVLTAHPAAAEAAGAQSVRRRLLVTEVSVYAERAANSLMALDQSNRLLARMRLPGGVTYMPVAPDSFLFKASIAWQFPAFAVCLGSSYLQRMLAANPQLAYRALVCPGFEEYVRYLPNLPTERPRKLVGVEADIALATLRSVQFACIFLATKVADQVHALGLLRFILTHLSHDGLVVSLQAAADVEARCLETLDWRLGPFFIEDGLEGDDHELWAAAMGHWDYGTSADSYPGGYPGF